MIPPIDRGNEAAINASRGISELAESRHKATKSQRSTKIVFVKLGGFESSWRRVYPSERNTKTLCVKKSTAMSILRNSSVVWLKAKLLRSQENTMKYMLL